MGTAASDEWRAEFRRREERRLDELIQSHGGLISRGLDALGLTFPEKLVPPFEAGLAMTSATLVRGAVAPIEWRGGATTLLYVVPALVASNERDAVHLHAVGSCGLCGRLAPLAPGLTVKDEREVSLSEREGHGELGLALAAREAIGSHRCGVMIAGDAEGAHAGGQYL